MWEQWRTSTTGESVLALLRKSKNPPRNQSINISVPSLKSLVIILTNHLSPLLRQKRRLQGQKLVEGSEIPTLDIQCKPPTLVVELTRVLTTPSSDSRLFRFGNFTKRCHSVGHQNYALMLLIWGKWNHLSLSLHIKNSSRNIRFWLKGLSGKDLIRLLVFRSWKNCWHLVEVQWVCGKGSFCKYTQKWGYF